MKPKTSSLTKREKIHIEDMRAELKRISRGRAELIEKTKELQSLKDKLDKDLEHVLIHYVGFKKGDEMDLAEIMMRTAMIHD